MQLRVPGPTPCPNEVLQAMSRQMIGHRGKEFGELMRHITDGLKKAFQTKNDVLILTNAGTGGLEAAVVNMLSPGDKVLSVSCGVFAERFADIATQYGAEVDHIRFEWGEASDPDVVRQRLQNNTNYKAVLVTQNETSTGVTDDIASLAKVIKEHDKLMLVDAVSGLGAIDLPVDEWQCDVVVTGSQKAWMIPPGLSMISVSEKAWQAYKEAKMPRYYFDLGKAKTFLEKDQTPWTPAVSLFYGLEAALELMEAEGLANVFARHTKVATTIRSGLKSMGLSLFPKNESIASDSVTAVRVPEGVDVNKLRQVLREDYSLFIAGGQQKLGGKIFRIGHLGWVTEKDAEEILASVKGALPKVGFSPR